MSGGRIFVGRKAELAQFKKVIEDPRGQAVLVVGHRGMGKTWLINRMAELAESHPNLKCGCVRYEVTPTDSVASTMALMMDDAYEAGRSLREGLKITDKNKEMWKALFAAAQVLPVIGSKVKGVKELGELILSLHREPARDTRAQFLNVLNHMSKRVKDNARAILIIDPEKYMQEKSASDWRIVVKQLPAKVILIFAQRTEDELVKDKLFRALENVTLIPPGHLGRLADTEVQELVRLRATGVGQLGNVLCDAVERYDGHPYAIQAALDIVKKRRSIEQLPYDPTPEAIAETQWGEVCNVGSDAISLFEAYAILEVGVPDEVVQELSGLSSPARKRLQEDTYVRGLLREEAYGKRIYHAILADYIVGQISDAEKKAYHRRAASVYRGKLNDARERQTTPDALAATRLAEHVLPAEGENAFVETFVNTCACALLNLGLLDNAISLSERALGCIEKGSLEEAALLGNLGMIHQARGDLAKAEQMHAKALETNEKLGHLEGVANQYGNLGLVYQMRGDLTRAEEMIHKVLDIDNKLGRLDSIAKAHGNLGVIWLTRGDLDKAEQMLTKSLEISEKLGQLEGMASDYGNLGLIYRKRGDLDKAEQMHKMALEIDEKLGFLQGMATDCANLGLIYRDRGDLFRAEHMYIKALEIAEGLGWIQGVASQYGNLGSIYRARGNLEKSKEYWEKSLELFKKIGMKPEIEKTQRLIDELEDKSKVKRQKQKGNRR